MWMDSPAGRVVTTRGHVAESALFLFTGERDGRFRPFAYSLMEKNESAFLFFRERSQMISAVR